jgi:uncharacterized protein GlcG (DUF336 family)
MPKLTLPKANRIIALAFGTANERGLKPLAVVVLDAGGNVKAAQIQDNVPIGRFEVAAGKARGALFVASGSRVLHDMAVARPHFIQGVSSVIAGGIIPVPGGVTIRARNGEVVGAVGISGDTSDNDEAAAVAGITGAGLLADTGG